MISPILSRTGTDNATAARNVPLGSVQGITPAATEANTRNVMASSGTLANWFIMRGVAPGVGTSVTYVVNKNGTPTSLSLTISDTNVTSSDTVNSVSYVAGDVLSITLTPTGTVATANMAWSFENNSAGQQLITGDINALPNAGSSYLGLQNSVQLTTAPAAEVAIPTAGTINNLYMDSTVAAGAGKSWTATLVVNGVDTSLVAVMTGTGVATANDITHSVAINAGDLAYWRVDPAGAPTVARLRIGAVFTPTIDGESMQTASSSSSLATTTNHSGVGATGAGYSATENTRADYLGTAFDLKKLYAALGTAPGVGKSYTFTVRSNLASTTVTAPISDTSTTANDNTHTAAATVPGYIGVLIAGAGTPTVGTAEWGFVTYRAPIGGTLSVSVSESITVSESRTVLIPTLNINRSESITVTDTPVVSIATTSTPVSASDTVTLTESVALSVDLAVVVTPEAQKVSIDSYPEVNTSGFVPMSADFITGVSQSFTGNGKTVGSAAFYLRKTGLPTGLATANIYAHSGTFGTDSVPTGSPLATSDTFDFSTLTTTLSLITLTFSGANQIALTNGTNYVLTIEGYGVDSSNSVGVSIDATAPTHPGNRASFAVGLGSWVPAPTHDVVFYLFDNSPYSDTITLTESNSTAIQSIATPAISKSDTITTTESVSVSVQTVTTLAINQSESITVTESRVLALTPLFINKSESITLTESVAASIVTPVTTSTKLLALLGAG